MQTINESDFSNIFFRNDELCTLNACPGDQVYGETLYTTDNYEYRAWNPHRSKLAALILNGCKFLPLNEDTDILYLGAANGTTASHISDIAVNGNIYCIEFSVRAFRDLLKVGSIRKNLFPILEDAFHPDRYRSMIGQVDLLYQGLAQRDQVRSFTINAKQFLKPDGYGIFMVKSRSIDISRAPSEIFDKVIKELKLAGFRILEKHSLEPYSKDHIGLVLKFK